MKASGMPPASTRSSGSGTRAQWAAATVRSSAWPPPAMIPITRSPGQGWATAEPTASTVPANSRPGMSAGAPGGAGYRPARWSRSARLMPAPATRTRTWSAAGSGMGRSSITRRPPSWMTRARMEAQPNGVPDRGLQPALGRTEEVAAAGQAPFEGVAERLLALEDLRQRTLLAGHHREAPLGGVGGRRERVDGRHLEGQLPAADPGQLGGQHEQVGPVAERGQHPGEGEGELVALGRRLVLVEAVHGVFEGEQGAGVDVEGQVEVDRPASALLGVEVDLPVLTQ